MTTDTEVTPREGWQDGPPAGWDDPDAPDVAPNGATHVESVREPYTPPAAEANGRQPSEAEATPTLVQRLRDRLVRVEASWIANKPPPLAYLVCDSRTGKGAIEAEGTGLLVAAGASGKGFTSLSLGLAVSTGTPWLGCMTVEHRGRVLFVSAEDGARTHLRYRIHAMAHAMGIKALGENFDILDVRDLHVPMLTPDGVPGEGTEALAEFVREHGPYALVVLDPISRVAGASIDADNVAATALLGCFEAISVASGGFVMGCHHTSLAARKAGDTSTTGSRGATGLTDSARAVLTLSVERLVHGDADLNAHLGELVTVRLTKANHVRAWEPIVMRRRTDGALLPLDAADLERVEQARQRAKPSDMRKGEREADAAAKKEREGAEREAVRAASQRAAAAREHELDAAAIAAVGERPGIGTTDLRTAVRARARCGPDVADVAVARLVTRGRLVRRKADKGNGVHYSLSDSGGAPASPPSRENPPTPPASVEPEAEADASAPGDEAEADEADEASEAGADEGSPS